MLLLELGASLGVRCFSWRQPGASLEAGFFASFLWRAPAQKIVPMEEQWPNRLLLSHKAVTGAIGNTNTQYVLKYMGNLFFFEGLGDS